MQKSLLSTLILSMKGRKEEKEEVVNDHFYLLTQYTLITALSISCSAPITDLLNNDGGLSSLLRLANL